MKKRLDVLPSNEAWRKAARRRRRSPGGLVPGYDKPGQPVAEDSELWSWAAAVRLAWGELAGAFEQLHLELDQRDAIDVGASTGGFTDYLLQHGIGRVIAVDVGYGQLHPKLRDDPRVTVLERTNARDLTELPFRPDLLVADVSFISVRIALPPVLRLLDEGWDAVVLVKPSSRWGRTRSAAAGSSGIRSSIAASSAGRRCRSAVVRPRSAS